MIIHVYPTNDLEPHDIESHLCKCEPKIEYVEGSMLVIHNSYDGRELIEEANKILNIEK